MSLAKKSPLLKFAIAACAALPLLAGCAPNATPLCPDSGTGIGTSSMSVVFNAAAAAKTCTVQASDLQSGQHYRFDGGALIINGNLPPRTEITATNAKVTINGNIPGTTSVESRVPIDTYNTTSIIPVWTGKSMIMIPQTHTRFAGYTHDSDHDPALTINGNVADGARLTSNHGILVNGTLGRASIKHTMSDQYSTLQTGPAASPSP